MTTKPQYRIEKVSVCEKCQGAKVVQNPAWVAFYAAHPDYDGSLGESGELAWFEKSGWSDDPTFLPYEEITCSDCEGEGRIVEYIDLRQALQEIREENEAPRLLAELSLALDLASRLNVGDKNINPSNDAKAWGNPSPFQDKINELLEFSGREATEPREDSPVDPTPLFNDDPNF